MRKMLLHQSAVIGMMLMVVGAMLIVASMSWGYNLVLLLLSFACVSGVGMAICFTTLTVLSVQKVPHVAAWCCVGHCNYCLLPGRRNGTRGSVDRNGRHDRNKISQLPVVMLMMFAVAGVAGLL